MPWGRLLLVVAWLILLDINPTLSEVITTVVETVITETSTSTETPYSISTEKIEVPFTEDVPVMTTTMVSRVTHLVRSFSFLTLQRLPLRSSTVPQRVPTQNWD